ncbi:prepilin-type N-terminal cleavage/methylation domain-containing protein [Seongchinamella unica]|uniref:Prepilin-type N-terminal cleavage/methylation domain-containing protein n=2 Tax=Seongchinamella unica TaxID=2547392 RepID=A0A4R5LQX2_9GAMM|nr:prepilin-type N-terminal cleavage/methylation domain-containing protein [Seongchinamella unica]
MGGQPRLQTKQRGFTLIELMVVVIIVAVLLAIALPAYQNQVRRGNRAAAQAEMLGIANLQQQYLLSNRTYMGLTELNASGYVMDPDVERNYVNPPTITLGGGTVPSYTLRFVPKGQQSVDGWLELNSEGDYTSEFPDKWDR